MGMMATRPFIDTLVDDMHRFISAIEHTYQVQLVGDRADLKVKPYRDMVGKVSEQYALSVFAAWKEKLHKKYHPSKEDTVFCYVEEYHTDEKACTRLRERGTNREVEILSSKPQDERQKSELLLQLKQLSNSYPSLFSKDGKYAIKLFGSIKTCNAMDSSICIDLGEVWAWVIEIMQ